MPPFSGAYGMSAAYAAPLDNLATKIANSMASRRNSRPKRHSTESFTSTGKRLQLVERHMSQRLNADRKVNMGELYDSLYPVRQVVVESSFQMSSPVGQKMTCMNAFRHQDLGVLDKEAATIACMSSGTQEWGQGDQLTIEGNANLTKSGYVMRGYGVTLQNNTGQPVNNNLAVQAQMQIGPGNHTQNGLAPIGANAYNDLVGNRFNVDTPPYTSVFDGFGVNNQKVRYPNLDQNSVGVSDIMGAVQTLWSPICAQSIEAAAANLGYNALGKGTVSQVQGHLNAVQKGRSSGKNFGPLPISRQDNTTELLVPRDELDAEGTNFTWNKHSVDYKFTNTYTYPVEVEAVVFKAHGLTSRGVVGNAEDTGVTVPSGEAVTEYYPGFNGPLPWSSNKGGIFNIIWGNFDYPPNPGTVNNQVGAANRIMALDFINSWTNHIGRANRGSQGIQLPEVDITGYPSPQTAIGRFQLNTKPHWPLTNARWRNWQFPKGGSKGSNFLREFSRKKIKIQPGEQVSLDLDLGGFKYSLSDVGYLSKQVDTNVIPNPPNDTNMFKRLQWTCDGGGLTADDPTYHFAKKGLMNGSVVVSLTLKGTPCAANAPLLAVGPDYPTRANDSGTSISLSKVPPLVDYGAGGGQTPEPVPLTEVPRGNYATGTVHSAGTLLVECKEKVSFQPMMNKRPKFTRNTATKTNHSLLINPAIPADAVIRTVDQSAVKPYATTLVGNVDSTKTVKQP